jgi:hypothetical protein
MESGQTTTLAISGISVGYVNNRIDLLSEFDASYRNYGMRISGAAWYDDGMRVGLTILRIYRPNTQAAFLGGQQPVARWFAEFHGQVW